MLYLYYYCYIYIIVIICTTGHYNLTAEDIEDSWDISGPVKNDTWIIEHFVLFPMFKSFKIHLDNLFEGNREISK